jgi:hypothetical protein
MDTQHKLPERHVSSLAVARELVLHQMKELLAEGSDPRAIAPLMLWGPPGIGKSDLVRELCAEHGWDFVDVRLAQRDPVDLRGLPVPDGSVVRWLPSSDWPRADRPRGILLFDELTAADRTLQVAAYELILDRRLGDTYSLPPGWLVCGAGNRSEDSAVSMPMSAALANRFLHLDLQADLATWITWARAHGVRDDIVAFLRFRPALLLQMDHADLQRGWPSPRSWARVSRYLDSATQGAQPLSRAALRAGIIGLVGFGPAIELEAFRESACGLPDPMAVLAGEAPVGPLPTEPNKLYALVTGLARLVWTMPDRHKSVGILLHIATLLPADFAALLYADALWLAPGDAGAELIFHPALQRFRARHGHLFSEPEPRPSASVEPAWQSQIRRERKAARSR